MTVISAPSCAAARPFALPTIPPATLPLMPCAAQPTVAPAMSVWSSVPVAARAADHRAIDRRGVDGYVSSVAKRFADFRGTDVNAVTPHPPRGIPR